MSSNSNSTAPAESQAQKIGAAFTRTLLGCVEKDFAVTTVLASKLVEALAAQGLQIVPIAAPALSINEADPA
jgi:hypothetical protein